jgi:hypothetical protein
MNEKELLLAALNYCLALKYDLYSMGGWNCFLGTSTP